LTAAQRRGIVSGMPVSAERQQLAIMAAGKLWNVFADIGCTQWKKFILGAAKKGKEIDVNYSFDDPKPFEELSKSEKGPEILKQFAQATGEATRFLGKGLGGMWTQYGLMLERDEKGNLQVTLQVEPKGA
jgi:hypothetical protein